jgi:hypothetical protein
MMSLLYGQYDAATPTACYCRRRWILGTAGEFLADVSIVEHASVSGDMLTYNIS